MATIQYKCFASKRSFGVEFETSPNITKSDIKKLIQMVCTRDVYVSSWEQSIDNSFWHVKQDSTCGPLSHRKSQYGWEVASFKANGHKNITHIARVAQHLSNSGLQTNNNCGLHVHAEVKDYDERQVAILLAWWVKIEPIIGLMLPECRINNKHCRMWSKNRNLSVSTSYTASDLWRIVRPTEYGPHGNTQKKMTLNLVNFGAVVAGARNGRRTLELRMPDGTLQGEDVAGWIKLFIHFVSTCRTRKMPKNMRVVKTIDEFLEVLGLHDREIFFILSTGLRKTKEWILRRIISSKWAAKSNPRMIVESKKTLQMMYEPFPIDENLDENGSKINMKSNTKKTQKKEKKEKKEKINYSDKLWDYHKYIDRNWSKYE
jgi:hypothetical protein